MELSSPVFRHHSAVSVAATAPARWIGFAILAILALLYIAQASEAATKTVQVQTLRQQADSLQNDVDQLKLEQDRAKTLDMIASQASPLALEPIDGVEYLHR